MGLKRQCTKLLQTFTSAHRQRYLHSKQATIHPSSHFNLGNEHELPWWKEATLYVHWPFCQKRCTYCNFNKYIAPNVDHDRMKRCLVTEVRTLLELSRVKQINSIFFGGGTPSLATPDVLGAVIEAAGKLVTMPTDIEISMEANPTSFEMAKLIEFKCAGINRLSLGIQALNDDDLRSLGRDHTVYQSLACIQEGKKLFPGRLSIDIIFGRPGQTVESWDAELDKILHICDSHMSLYQLTLEPGTLLYKLNQHGALSVPDSDKMAEMYEVAVRRLAQAGFHRYEVSNFARNSAAESRHNKAYWEGKQYIGIGPGAHGRFCPITEPSYNSNENLVSETLISRSQAPKLSTTPTVLEIRNTHSHLKRHALLKSCKYVNEKRLDCDHSNFVSRNSNDVKTERLVSFPNREARIQTLEPETWMWEVEKFRHATRKRVVQSQADILQEHLLLGLRTSQGITNQTWMQFYPGVSLMDVFGSDEFVIDSVRSGLIDIDNTGLRCTTKGLNLLDSLMPNLILILSQYLDE